MESRTAPQTRQEQSSPKQVSLLSACLAASVIVIGCGNSGNREEETIKSSATVKLSGTAAIGAAITDAAVTASCSDGSGFINAVTSKSNGTFEGRVDQDALPCALRVSKPSESIVLHSIAISAGVSNITPLTDMALSVASNERPADWFASPTLFDVIDTHLPAAKQLLLTSLEAAGFSVPADEFDPFTGNFSIGDSADQLLDEIQESLAASATVNDYDALIDVIKDGNIETFPLEPEDSGGSTTTALDCFNAELYQQGALVSMVHNVTAANTMTTTESIEYEVTTNDGSNVTISETLETVTDLGNLISTRTSIDDYDIPSSPSSGEYAAYVRKNSSSYTTVFADNMLAEISGTEVISDTVGFRLNEGESNTVNAPLTDTGPTPAWTLIRQGNRTYTAKETITVPAGTYTACRFDLDLVYTGAVNHPVYGSNPQLQFNESITEWYAQDSGVLLKLVQENGETRELVSASINGEGI